MAPLGEGSAENADGNVSGRDGRPCAVSRGDMKRRFNAVPSRDTLSSLERSDYGR